MKVASPGVYRMADEVYHADPCVEPSLSSSGAKTLVDACPARFWHEREHPREPSRAQNTGTAAHMLVLEGKSAEDAFAVIPAGTDARRKEGKAKIAELRETGLPLIKEEDVQATRDMADALTRHPTARRLLEDGRAEMSAFWFDDTHEVWCRARPDYLPRRLSVISDYKTTEDANPDTLPRTVARWRYYLSAAWYLDGMRALGRAADRFVFIFQEKTPPYLVTCATLDEDALERGRRAGQRARRMFGECLRAGSWPPYPEQVHVLSLPAWALRQEEMFE